jgi:hypothetical protein
VSASAKPTRLATPSTTAHGPAPRPTHTQAKAAGDLKYRGEHEEGDVGSHISSKAAMNSRVPCGPVRSRVSGPSSGSTVIVKRRKRQQCRSASTAPAMPASVSADEANRSRSPAGRSSWPVDRRSSSASRPSRRARSAFGVSVQTMAGPTCRAPFTSYRATAGGGACRARHIRSADTARTTASTAFNTRTSTQGTSAVPIVAPAREPSAIGNRQDGFLRRIPYARYVGEPGFYVEAKARVASDFTAVTPMLEFYVGSHRSPEDWTLQLDPLERSCGGDGCYAIFADADGVPVDVWVTWSEREALWHIPRLSGEGPVFTFKRPGYEEAVRTAILSPGGQRASMRGEEPPQFITEGGAQRRRSRAGASGGGGRDLQCSRSNRIDRSVSNKINRHARLCPINPAHRPYPG